MPTRPIDPRVEAPVAPGNLVPVDDGRSHPAAAPCTVGLRAARNGPAAASVKFMSRSAIGTTPASADAEHFALAQVDDRIETLDRPAPHVRRRAAQVIAADLDDAFACMLRDGEVPGGEWRAEDFLRIGHAAFRQCRAEFRMGQDDLRGLELGHHHGRLDTLALGRRDEASGGQIDDELEHARRRQDDQPRLTWQRRARLPG